MPDNNTTPLIQPQGTFRCVLCGFDKARVLLRAPNYDPVPHLMVYGYCTRCSFVSLWGNSEALDVASSIVYGQRSLKAELSTYHFQEQVETKSVVDSILTNASLSDQVKDQLQSGIGKRFLHVGCGAAGSLSIFQSMGWSGAGVEPEANAGSFARSLGLDVKTESYTRSSIERTSLDMVYSYHSLEHFANPFEAINNWACHLKPGGLLYVECPNVLDTTWRQLGYDHWGLFSPATLSGSLETAGFEVLAEIDRRDYSTHGVALIAQRKAMNQGTSSQDLPFIPSEGIAWAFPSFTKMRVALNYAYYCGRTRDISVVRFPIQMLHLLIASKVRSRRLKSVGRRVAAALKLVGSSKP